MAEESKFMADVVVEDMLSTAERSAKSLQAEAKIPQEAPKEEAKEQAPVEEKVAESVEEEPKAQEASKEE